MADDEKDPETTTTNFRPMSVLARGDQESPSKESQQQLDDYARTNSYRPDAVELDQDDREDGDGDVNDSVPDPETDGREAHGLTTTEFRPADFEEPAEES